MGNKFNYEEEYEDASNLKKRSSSSSRSSAARTGERPGVKTQTRSSSAASGRSTGSSSGRSSSGNRKSSAARAKRRKRQRRKRMIAICAVILIVVIIVVVIILIANGSHKNQEEETETTEKVIEVLDTRSSSAEINKLYIYGTHLNMEGTLPEEVIDQGYTIDLVLYNGDFISVPIEITDNTFTLSEYTNGGLYLEDVARGEYTMFIRAASTSPFEGETAETETAGEDGTGSASDTTTAAESGTEQGETTEAAGLPKKKTETEETTEAETVTDENGEAVTSESEEETTEAVKYYRYYTLKNTTDYDTTEYYSLSNTDNYIVIENENTYPTMCMNVTESTADDVYDVVIDPGHGGIDGGATGYDDYCERDFMLPLALKVKALLEEQGLKVALTRDNDDETVYPYGDDGRIARACKTKAKYLFSFHMNSTGTGGLEIYTAAGIDYTFAENLRDTLKEIAGIGDTANAGSSSLTDIFSRNFTQSDVDEAIAEDTAEGLTPYEPTTDSSYYFIIREAGGIVTGAFKDDRNAGEDYNPYCYSNSVPESYITELGYITVQEDEENMRNNMDSFAEALAEGIGSLYK